MENKKVYVLTGRKSSRLYGIYSSQEQLKLGVGYWIPEFEKYAHSDDALAYEEWQINSQEPLCWGYAYIKKNSIREDLEEGGGIAPAPSYWGQNLIGVDWDYDEELRKRWNK